MVVVNTGASESVSVTLADPVDASPYSHFGVAAVSTPRYHDGANVFPLLSVKASCVNACGPPVS